ncbi:MAG: TetR/AcrR family transcriptional regulator [Spirochaetales bacterium]
MSRQPDEDKQQRILKAAIEVFGTQGLERATMKDIADLAGVAPGTLYTYFADKEALFVGAVDRVWDDFFAGTEAILAKGSDPRTSSKALLGYGLEMLKALYPLVRGMISAANRLDLMHARLDSLALLISKSMSGLPNATFETMRIWISGVLFLLATVPHKDIDHEIDRVKGSLLRLLEAP